MSPQAITIMFMPNSPTPPSGTISSGGVDARGISRTHGQQTGIQGLVDKADTFFQQIWTQRDDRAHRVAGTSENEHGRGGSRPGGAGHGVGGGAAAHRVLRPAAGTAGKRGQQNRGQTIAQLTVSTPTLNEPVRKPRQFCELQRLGAPPTGRSGADARRPRAGRDPAKPA